MSLINLLIIDLYNASLLRTVEIHPGEKNEYDLEDRLQDGEGAFIPFEEQCSFDTAKIPPGKSMSEFHTAILNANTGQMNKTHMP